MIKLCFLLLTLNSNNEPTLINFNNVIAVAREPSFGQKYTRVHISDSAFAIKVNETAEQISEKLKSCNPSRGNDMFVYVK